VFQIVWTTLSANPVQNEEPVMAMIYVKTKPDRRAYFEGKIIPQDKFVPVTDTPYVRRLIEHWEDVEVQEGSDERRKPKKEKVKPDAA
jgi:hypothetical protein